MNRKLTKTEKNLLEELKSRAGSKRWSSVSIEWTHGEGPEGGSFSSGSRKYNAARNLVRRGLAKELHSDSYGASSGGGYSYRGSVISIELA